MGPTEKFIPFRDVSGHGGEDLEEGEESRLGKGVRDQSAPFRTSVPGTWTGGPGNIPQDGPSLGRRGFTHTRSR